MRGSGRGQVGMMEHRDAKRHAALSILSEDARRLLFHLADEDESAERAFRERRRTWREGRSPKAPEPGWRWIPLHIAAMSFGWQSVLELARGLDLLGVIELRLRGADGGHGQARLTQLGRRLVWGVGRRA